MILSLILTFNSIKRECWLKLKVVLITLVLTHGLIEAAPLEVLRFVQGSEADVRENALAGRETGRPGNSLHTAQTSPVTGGNLQRTMRQ